MECVRYRIHLSIAGLALVGLPVIGVAAPPTSLADDFDCIGSISLDCMADSDDDFFGQGGFGNSGGFQAGDLVLPAGGGPPEVAAGPAPDGGPVVTAGGDLVIPAGPPIG